MSGYNYLKVELARLKQENEALRDEVATLRQYMDALQSLIGAIDELDSAEEIRSLLDRMLYNAMALTDAKDGSLLILDENTGELVFVLARGEVDPALLLNRRIPAGKGIAGWVVANRRPTIVQHAQSDVRFYASIDEALGFTTDSILAAPIVSDNQVVGVVELLNKHNNQPFNETEQTLLMILCRFAGEVVSKMMRVEDEEAEDYQGSIPQ